MYEGGRTDGRDTATYALYARTLLGSVYEHVHTFSLRTHSVYQSMPINAMYLAPARVQFEDNAVRPGKQTEERQDVGPEVQPIRARILRGQTPRHEALVMMVETVH